MKKNSTKGYAILGVLFILVSVIAFAVPVAKTTTFWILYAFTVIAFSAQIVIWKTALGRGESLKGKFLGFSVVHIGIVYLVGQILVLAVFLIFPALPVWSAVIACTAIAGVFAVCIIASCVGRSEIERISEKAQKKVFYIRELQTDVELMAAAERDADTKTAFAQLAEKIRFSDPMSNEKLTDLEAEISAKIAGLKTVANKMEAVAELTLLLDERNRKCKIFK